MAVAPKAAAKAKAAAAAKAKQAREGIAIRMSLAETIQLPYRPTSFKIRDMRRVIADVKRAQG